jgi:hypothetical protein
MIIISLQLVVAQSPCCTGDPSVGTTTFHQIHVYQGDDPNTDEKEPRDRVRVVEYTRWLVPWNSSQLYHYMPEDASRITLDNVAYVSTSQGPTYTHGPYSAALNPDNPPTVGWVTEGTFAGYYGWAFSEAAETTRPAVLSLLSEVEFIDYDSTQTNGSHWVIGNETLELAPGVPMSNYTYRGYEFGDDIISVRMNATPLANEENITYWASEDNGTSWYMAENGTDLNLSSLGNQFRFRIEMSQNTSLNNTPVLDKLTVIVSYSPIDIWLQSSYELELKKDGLEWDVWFPFDQGAGLVILAYVDPDVKVDVNGTSTTLGEHASYPGKVVYMHMSGPFSSVLTFTIQEEEEDAGLSTSMLLALVVVLILIVAVALAYVRYRSEEEPPEEEPSEEDEEPSEEDEGPAPSEAKEPSDIAEGSVEELEAKKEKLLQAIKRVGREHEDGLISEDEHGRLTSTYRKRTIEIMKELENRKEQ